MIEEKTKKEFPNYEELNKSHRKEIVPLLHQITKTMLSTPWADWGANFIQVKCLMFDHSLLEYLHDRANGMDLDRGARPEEFPDIDRYGWWDDIGVSVRVEKKEKGKGILFDEEGYYYTWVYIREAHHSGWKLIRSKDSNVIALVDIILESYLDPREYGPEGSIDALFSDLKGREW